MTASGVADPAAREFLRKADPILARVIDAHPGFRPRAWMDDLPPLDAFGTLIFQVVGQQLSVASTRAIVSRIEELFGGRMPTPAELLATDPQALRTAGLLMEVSGTGPWSAHGFLLVALDRPDVFLMSDIALRRAIIVSSRKRPIAAARLQQPAFFRASSLPAAAAIVDREHVATRPARSSRLVVRCRRCVA